jgi:hypothetical protein
MVTNPFSVFSEQLQAPASFPLVAIARTKLGKPLSCPPLFLACPLHRVIFPVLITWLTIDVNKREVDITVSDCCFETDDSSASHEVSVLSTYVQYALITSFSLILRLKHTKRNKFRPLKCDINIRYTDLRPQKCVPSSIYVTTTSIKLWIPHYKVKCCLAV